MSMSRQAIAHRIAASDRPVLASMRRGFTLIELMVVIAITSILLTLIFKPLIDSFNLTRRAGTQIESQAAARGAMREINSLLSNAVYVFDNSDTELNLWLTDQTGAQYAEPTPFSMIEYVKPARQLDQIPGKLPIDPTTGEPIYDSGLTSGESGVAQPLAKNSVLGRLWIGLIDNTSDNNNRPSRPYGSRWEDPVTVTPPKDNRYTLWHAEVPIYVRDPRTGQYVVNEGLFRVDTQTKLPILHDPNFFYDNSLAGGDGDRKWAMPGWKPGPDNLVHIWQNWRAVARTLMPLNSVDMVALDRDEVTNRIRYDATSKKPTARPLARFTPGYVENDAAVPTGLDASSAESTTQAPVSYTSLYNHWAKDFRVLVYRSPETAKNGPWQTDPLTLNPLNYYQYANGKIVHQIVARGAQPPDTSGPDVGPNLGGVNKNWASGSVEYAFTVDAERGVVNFAFPSQVTASSYPTDPDLGAQRYSPREINANLEGLFGKRFLYLADMPVTNWGEPPLPLNAAASRSIVKLYRNAKIADLPKVHLVPGSERVYGPDQRPGPHFGYRVLYHRVSSNAGSIGLNEYKILYDDIPNAEAAGDDDPRVRMGYLEFRSLWDGPNLPNSQAADPANPGGPNSLPVKKVLPDGRIVDADAVEVNYWFQMNRPNDVVKVDYLTREMMNVVLQARLYDPGSARPQVTDLTEKIKVRNLQH